jgi:predicted CoA-binding protein
MEAGKQRSLEPRPVGRLLRPRSVAIVGASPDRGSIGFNALENLLRAGYQSEIHLVSRSRKEIDGRLCVPSIDELPLGVDAVVLPRSRRAAAWGCWVPTASASAILPAMSR